jgi:hypothetical protein
MLLISVILDNFCVTSTRSLGFGTVGFAGDSDEIVQSNEFLCGPVSWTRPRSLFSSHWPPRITAWFRRHFGVREWSDLDPLHWYPRTKRLFQSAERNQCSQEIRNRLAEKPRHFQHPQLIPNITGSYDVGLSRFQPFLVTGKIPWILEPSPLRHLQDWIPSFCSNGGILCVKPQLVVQAYMTENIQGKYTDQ